ncbi:MAG TPA: DMT family transporter [Falsiroseomonas sp.]|jgi:drug/metabolite transporter (DMT)-like permease|nr:DMT family transporter [Falsiroseomonas sp.]
MSPATLAGCGALILWAFLALLSRLASGIPPLQLTAMGFAVGGTVGLAVVLARGGAAALRQKPIAWAHGVGGLFGYHALFFLAFALAPAVEVNLINYLWPLLIVLLSAPVLGLRLGPERLLGVSLGASGCILLLMGPGASFPPEAFPGFLAAAGAAVVWAVYSVTSGVPRLARVPTEAVAGFCLATAALAALLHLLFESTVLPGSGQWLAVIGLGLGPVGAAFFLWDIGMKRGDPRLLGTLAYAVPVASTLLLILAGEGEMTLRAVAATLMVAGGGFIAARAL